MKNIRIGSIEIRRTENTSSLEIVKWENNYYYKNYSAMEKQIDGRYRERGTSNNFVSKELVEEVKENCIQIGKIEIVDEDFTVSFKGSRYLNLSMDDYTDIIFMLQFIKNQTN